MRSFIPRPLAIGLAAAGICLAAAACGPSNSGSSSSSSAPVPTSASQAANTAKADVAKFEKLPGGKQIAGEITGVSAKCNNAGHYYTKTGLTAIYTCYKTVVKSIPPAQRGAFFQQAGKLFFSTKAWKPENHAAFEAQLTQWAAKNITLKAAG